MSVDKGMYDKAVAAVKSGTAPDDVLDGLMDIIDEFEGRKGGLAAGAFDVPTAEQMKTKEAPAPPAPPGAFDVPTAEQATAQRAARQKVEASNPEIVKALTSSGLLGTSAAAQEHSRSFEQNYDRNLPSASQRPELFRPPENFPADSLSAFPSMAYGVPTKSGKRIVFHEPTVEEYRKERGIIGESSDASDDYKEWADRKYAQAYDDAEKKGVAIIRHDYELNKDTPSHRNDAFAQNFTGAVGGYAQGSGLSSLVPVGAKIAGVSPDELAQGERDIERAPGAARALGTLGGFFFSPAGKYINKAAAPGTSVLKGTAQGALRAGAASGAQTAVDTGVRKYVSGEDISGEEAVSRVGRSTGLGIIMGLTAGLPANAARRASEKLRENTPALPALEKRGLTTSTTSGVEPGPALQGTEDAAREAGFVDPATGKVRTKAYLASELEQPAATTARLEQGTAEARAADAKRGIYNLPENQRRISAEPLVAKLEEARGDLVDNSGKPLSPTSARQVKVIDDWLGRVRRESGQYTLQRGAPRDFTPKEADKLIQDLQSFDPVAVKSGASAEREPLHRYGEIKRAAHEMRDQIRGGTEDVPEGLQTTITDKQGRETTLHDYSAYEHGLARDQAEEARRRVAAGLPEGEVPERLSGNQSKQFRGVAENYGGGGESDTALEHFAGPGGGGQLEDIRSASQLEALREQSKARWSLNLYGGMIPIPRLQVSGTGLRLRADPALRAMSRGGPRSAALAPAAEQEYRRRRAPEPANPETIDMISRMLSIGQPF